MLPAFVLIPGLQKAICEQQKTQSKLRSTKKVAFNRKLADELQKAANIDQTNRGSVGKIAVMVMLERKGCLLAKVIESTVTFP